MNGCGDVLTAPICKAGDWTVDEGDVIIVSVL